MEAATGDITLRSVKDAAQLCGISVYTVRRLIREKRLTPYGTEGKRLVDVFELRAVLRGGPTKLPPHER